MWADLSPPYRTLVIDPPWPHNDAPLGYQRNYDRNTFLPYSSMTVDDITALPVGDLAAPAAYLYVWTTQRYIWAAREILRSWGWSTEPTVLTWCKAPMGKGGGNPAFCSTTEFVLYARRPVGALISAARDAAGIGRGELHRAVRSGEPTGIVYRWEAEADDCYPTPGDWDALRHHLPGLASLPDLTPDPLARIDTNWWQWKRGAHSSKPPAFLDVVEQVSPGPYAELFARAPRLGWDSWGHGYELSAHVG